MSPSRPLLIFLLLFLNPALGFPVAKRLSHSEISEDVLAGTDFLSVFMKTSPARSVTPSFKYSSIFGAKTRNSDYSETNSVVQKNKEDIHPYSDINLKGEDALESDSHVAVDHQAQLEHEEELIESNSPDNLFTQKTMTVAQKNDTDPTTSSPTTTAITDDSPPSTYYELEEEHPSIVQGFREDRSTKPTVTQYWSDPQPYPPTPASSNSSEQPLQVISVRVSSSVVRHSQKVEDPLKGFESEKTNKPASTLITQEQPTNIAVQRSHFNVEEATLPDDQASYHEVESRDKILPSLPITIAPSYQFNNFNNKPNSNENNLPKVYDSEIKQDESRKLIENISSELHQSEAEEEERKIEQTDFLKLPQNQNQSVPQNEELRRYLKDRMESRRKDYIEEETKPPDQRNEPRALPYQFKYNDKPHEPSSSNFQDHDFLKDGSIEKNSDFTDESHQTEERRDQPQALAFQYNPQNPQLSPISYHTSVSSATSGSRVQFYRGPPSYRRGNVAESVQRAVLAEPKRDFQFSVPTPQKQEHQGEPVEKSYELPEQNYEIDESISVVTNGRAHGVQIPTPTPTRQSSENEKEENKSGYVVEGRNFRKYRVEERTADGFIVGEYGVVSHDDGSLRGVRYTADSTINPRLIYDALVKFLSLK